MKSRGIIFRGDMVRAIREGRKTQTRRVVKPQPVGFIDSAPCSRIVRSRDGNVEESEPIRCPYGVPGDELWVRETFRFVDFETCDGRWSCGIDYRADGARGLARFFGGDDLTDLPMGWRPSIFMPREACRLTLVVRSVRVERLSAITEADVRAEGFPSEPRGAMGQTVRPGPRDCFLAAFRQMHKLPDDADPWLWVVGFEVKQ